MSEHPLLYDIHQSGGKTLFRRDCGAFVVVSSRVRPRETEERLHGHSFAYFSWLLRGESHETFVDGSEREAATWTPYFHPHGERHCARILRPSAVMAVRLKHPFRRELEDRYGKLDRPSELGGSAARELGRRIFSEAAIDDQASTLSLQGLVYELLAELIRRRNPLAEGYRDWPDRIWNLLHENWRSPLDLAELSRDVGKHPSHVSRVFRQRFGKTLGEQLREIRLDHARSALLATGQTVARVGVECGFYDESHFARAFRAKFGMSPRQYRDSHRDR